MGRIIHAGDRACVQARRTTDYVLTTVFADITLDATDVENDTATVEHDNTNTDRITLVRDGLYEIHYHYNGDAPAGGGDVAYIEGRVTVNDGGAALPGSETKIVTFDDSSIDGDILEEMAAATFEYQASAGDFISLQAQKTHPTGSSATALEGGSITLIAKPLCD